MSVLLIVEPKYTLAESCCPLVSHDEYADGTDGRTPDRYITLSARCRQRNKTRISKPESLITHNKHNKLKPSVVALASQVKKVTGHSHNLKDRTILESIFSKPGWDKRTD